MCFLCERRESTKPSQHVSACLWWSEAWERAVRWEKETQGVARGVEELVSVIL